MLQVKNRTHGVEFESSIKGIRMKNHNMLVQLITKGCFTSIFERELVRSYAGDHKK